MENISNISGEKNINFPADNEETVDCEFPDGGADADDALTAMPWRQVPVKT